MPRRSSARARGGPDKVASRSLMQAAEEAVLVIDALIYAEVSIGFDSIEEALPHDLYRREHLRRRPSCRVRLSDAAELVGSWGKQPPGNQVPEGTVPFRRASRWRP
jgi:hypothetical protein